MSLEALSSAREETRMSSRPPPPCGLVSSELSCRYRHSAVLSRCQCQELSVSFEQLKARHVVRHNAHGHTSLLEQINFAYEYGVDRVRMEVSYGVWAAAADLSATCTALYE